jgi:hypothetical protein
MPVVKACLAPRAASLPFGSEDLKITLANEHGYKDVLKMGRKGLYHDLLVKREFHVKRMAARYASHTHSSSALSDVVI